MSERICFRDDFPCVFKVYEGNDNIHVFPSSFLRLRIFGLLLGVEDTGHVTIENRLINLSLSLFHLFLCRFVHIVLRQLCLLHRVRARLGQFLVSVCGVACLPTFWQSILILNILNNQRLSLELCNDRNILNRNLTITNREKSADLRQQKTQLWVFYSLHAA